MRGFAIQPKTKTQIGRPPNRTRPQLLLPTSTKCPIKLHETLILSAARAGERQLSREERALAIKDFQIRSGASPVTHIGEAHSFLQVRDSILLPKADLMGFLIADQRI